MDIAKGELVRVVAGKYKGLLMTVVMTDGTSVYVSDGRHRKLEKPKKLNPKHVVRLKTVLEKEVSEYTNRFLWKELATKCPS